MSADPHITEVDKMQYADVSVSSYLDIRLVNDLTICENYGPDKCRLKMAGSTAPSEGLAMLLAGGYTTHPLPAPTFTIAELKSKLPCWLQARR